MTEEIEIGRPRAPDALHRAMNAAFSDYAVPLQLPYEHFRFMMLQRGFQPGLSRVAELEGGIASFWLIAARAEHGTAYTIATGTLPAFRKRGLATRVFEAVREELRAREFASLRLEVIEDNTAARHFYSKLGFETTRALVCFKLDVSALAPPRRVAYQLRTFDLRTIGDQLDQLQDWPPSWQSGFESLTSIGELVTVLGAFEGERCLGYGALTRHNGVLAQLAVRPEHRRKGLASAILAALAEEQEVLEIVNIDARDRSSQAFFRSRGARFHLRLKEMTSRL